VHFTTPTPGSQMYELFKDSLITSQNNRYQVGGLRLPALSSDELQHQYEQLQIQWRKNKDNKKHYKIAKKNYILKNLIQGLRRPLRYIIFILYLIADSNIFAYKILSGMKGIYIKMISFVIKGEKQL
jgi:hypothetical protein